MTSQRQLNKHGGYFSILHFFSLVKLYKYQETGGLMHDEVKNVTFCIQPWLKVHFVFMYNISKLFPSVETVFEFM